MTTTPNAYGRFIGRVGGLAVALGIGAAVANSPGLAFAEDGQSGGADGTTSSSQDSNPAASQETPSSNTSVSASVDDTPAVDVDAVTDDDSLADTDEDDSLLDDDSLVDEDDLLGEDDLLEEDDDLADEGDVEDTDGDTVDTTSASTDTDSDRQTGGGTDHELQSASQIVTAPPSADDAATTKRTRSTEQVDEQETSTATVFSATAEQDSAPPVATVASVVTTPPESTVVTTPVITSIGGLVSSFLSALGFGPQAADGSTAPQQSPAPWAMLAFARREIGNVSTPSLTTAAPAVTTSQTLSATTVSPLGTPEQLKAERLARETANSLPVVLMKIILRQGFLAAARQQYPDGLDEASLAALDKAVDEYALAAAFQQQLLNPMTPTVVTQVAPPHIWYGQSVGGSRILYDNPDTIYRFMAVSAASEYVITGRFHDLTEAGLPSETSFSVLEGLAGTTSTILSADDLEINPDGTFVITVSAAPADGRTNHLQLTSGSTIIAARDTLGNWTEETPISLSIERVGGPPNSLFAQIGGFAFLGPQVSTNPLLTTLVSLVPPLPYMPPILRGAFTAVILMVRGVNEQAKYMALASTDPQTGQPREANVLSQPASNAEFLSTQLQSTGNFELADDEVIVLTIDPGTANYFIVPTYNIWTITDDYWNQQTSLNNEQAIANADGTYTVVISPTDPGATNWVATGGLNQGAISIRFQDLGPDPNNENPPRIVDQRVMSHEALRDCLPPADFVTEQERAEQLAIRKAGYDRRWAPYPQP